MEKRQPAPEGHQISKGAFLIGAGKIATLLVYGVTAALIPRILGPTSMGFYSYWLSVFLILTMILDFGAAAILSRYIPEFRKNREELIRPLLKIVVFLKFPILLLILLAGTILFEGERSFFYIILTASFFLSIIAVERSMLYAYRDMRLYSIVPLARGIFRIILILLLFRLFKDAGILPAILLTTFFCSLIFLIPAISLIPDTPGNPKENLRPYLSFGFLLYLANIISVLTRWSVIIFSRKSVESLALVGCLGLGIHVCFTFVVRLVHVLGESIFPSLVEFHVTKDARFNTSLEALWKYSNMLLFPLVSGLLILSNPMITIIVGKQYLPSVQIIYAMLPAAVFAVWSFVYDKVLLVFEKQGAILLSRLIGYATFLISFFLLVGRWGITGSAFSVSLGGFATLICLFLASRKFRQVQSGIPHLFKPMFSSFIMGVVISRVPVQNLLSLCGTTLLGMIVYGSVMWLIDGITKTDIMRVKGVFQ